MTRPPRRAAFTLIEMITVIAIIAILAGLILAVNGVAQKKAARSRADAEIRDLSVAMESYKTDNGGYPQDANLTDSLDPTTVSAWDISQTGGGALAKSTRYLYQQLSGDTNGIGTIGNPGKNYAPDFWKPSRLGGTKDQNTGTVKLVQFIMDPFGNPYGYSTAGLAVEQQYRAALSTSPNAPRPPQKGYNPTFDMWSTAGNNTPPPATDPTSIALAQAKFVKNW